ncbi:hypothetical protein Tco_0253330, partial [Tanacetum coccineum]
MEHKHIFSSSVVPRLSPKHSWFVAQNSESEKDDGTQAHIFYNLHDPVSYFHCQIPELLGKRIRGCFHGCWAILSSNHPHYNISHYPRGQIRGFPGDLSLGIAFPGDMSPGISGTENLEWNSFPGDIPG